MECEWLDKIFDLDPDGFQGLALDIFRYQYERNPIYRSYCAQIGRSPDDIREIKQIPFLPISFFKTHRVVTSEFTPELVFQSSGTTGMTRSTHHVKAASFYETSYTRGFESTYGPVSGKRIMGLLPSYLEQGDSSLVYMVQGLIRDSGHPESGFFLNDHERLKDTLQKGGPTILIGVTYALLDFAGRFSFPLKETIVMETGGMKGRREELTRMEVHERLKQAFSLEKIHSEYGMTELLSQAYSQGEGIFACPPWMRVLLREEEDPLTVKKNPGNGVLNIIDLANLYSCSFIATEDAGRLRQDGTFEVLGRMDNSDIRGCSLLAL
ncbi:MAG: acyl transferase [Chitinophagaceae bacterium]|nr:acyl transferase [Chitinophagaceae bacterium]